MSDKKPIVDKDLIRELADLLKETGLTEIEVEQGDVRIRVGRAAAGVAMQMPAPAAVAMRAAISLEAMPPRPRPDTEPVAMASISGVIAVTSGICLALASPRGSAV